MHNFHIHLWHFMSKDSRAKYPQSYTDNSKARQPNVGLGVTTLPVMKIN